MDGMSRSGMLLGIIIILSAILGFIVLYKLGKRRIVVLLALALIGYAVWQLKDTLGIGPLGLLALGGLLLFLNRKQQQRQQPPAQQQQPPAQQPRRHRPWWWPF